MSEFTAKNEARKLGYDRAKQDRKLGDYREARRRRRALLHGAFGDQPTTEFNDLAYGTSGSR